MMRKIVVVMMSLAVFLVTGCGESIHWFPGNSSNGAIPNPAPSGQTVTEVQANTVTKFLPYTVKFGTISSSSTTASISITGDTDSSSMYSINNGTPTNVTGVVHKGDTVIVQNTSSNKQPNYPMLTTLNIGGTSARYVSQTGTLIFYTKTNQPKGQTIPSNTATVPSSFSNGFVLGTQGTLEFAAGSDSSSTLYFANNINQAIAVPCQIRAGDIILFKHTSALTSVTPVTTKAIITGTTGTYELTFTTVTQQ